MVSLAIVMAVGFAAVAARTPPAAANSPVNPAENLAGNLGEISGAGGISFLENMTETITRNLSEIKKEEIAKVKEGNDKNVDSGFDVKALSASELQKMCFDSVFQAVSEKKTILTRVMSKHYRVLSRNVAPGEIFKGCGAAFIDVTKDLTSYRESIKKLLSRTQSPWSRAVTKEDINNPTQNTLKSYLPSNVTPKTMKAILALRAAVEVMLAKKMDTEKAKKLTAEFRFLDGKAP